MKFSKLFGCMLFLIVLPVATASIDVNIFEEGKIMDYYEQYYIYQLNGSITVDNPTNFTIYNIEIPFFVSTLTMHTNESSGLNYMNQNQVFVHSLEAGKSYTFNYRISGIATGDLTGADNTVLGRAIVTNQPKIYSNLMGTLLKAPLENTSAGGNANTRLISVELRNPTDFTYSIDKMDVIKTSSMDPNMELNKWSFASNKNSLDGNEGWDFDFLDKDAHEGEIYWLSSDIYINAVNVNSTSNISHYSQDELFTVLSNDTLNVSINSSLGFLSDRVYLRKFASSSVVNPGNIINLTLVINNLEPRKIDVEVMDSIPRGFEIVTASEGSVDNRNISWSSSIGRDSVKRLTYSLRYTDEELLGLDYFPAATLTYDGKSFSSQSVPFVRKYIPDKKIFVQKNVQFLSGDEVQVTISMKNLGESSLENVVLKEHLLSSAEFREISVSPAERGVWLISELNSSQDWKVSYVTDRQSVLNTMPEVYGVPQSSILQTIILSNLISSSFSIIPTNIIEIVAIVILAIILLMYFVPTSYFSRQHKRQARDLSLMSQEISHLQQETQLRKPAPPSSHGSTSQQFPQDHSPVPSHAPLQSAERAARHDAVNETVSLMSDSKKKIMGKEAASEQNTPPKDSSVDDSSKENDKKDKKENS